MGKGKGTKNCGGHEHSVPHHVQWSRPLGRRGRQQEKLSPSFGGEVDKGRSSHPPCPVRPSKAHPLATMLISSTGGHLPPRGMHGMASISQVMHGTAATSLAWYSTSRTCSFFGTYRRTPRGPHPTAQAAQGGVGPPRTRPPLCPRLSRPPADIDLVHTSHRRREPPRRSGWKRVSPVAAAAVAFAPLSFVSG